VDKNKIPIIGNKIEVIRATQVALVGIKGLVVDETANTLTLTINGEEKILLKSAITFAINQHTIIGVHIKKRPEERIKTKQRRI